MGRVSIGVYEESLGWFLPINAVARAFLKDPPWGGGPASRLEKGRWLTPPLGLGWLGPNFPNKNFTAHKKLQKIGACGTNIIFSFTISHLPLFFLKKIGLERRKYQKNNCCNNTFDKEDVRLVTKILLTQKNRENYEPI